jgi:hypothetical protein
MGVDYLKCDGCDSGYRDDSEYCCSCDCGNSFCGISCGKFENYFNPFLLNEKNGRRQEIDDSDPRYDDWENGIYGVDKEKPITCVLCRKEKANDWLLLEAILRHYKITREDAMKIYKEEDND